ncbi:hypothetical protein GGG16DRAFT_119676 [Schizophyllum commune]
MLARRSLPQANDWAVSHPRLTVEHCLLSSLFPYALHSTMIAFNIVRASKSPRGIPSLCTPLYEAAMHSTTPLCTPLCKTSRLLTSPNSRNASSTFTLEAVASDALKGVASGALDTTDLLPTIVVDSRAEATYLHDFALDIRLRYQPTHSQSTFAFAIDLRIRNRPTLFAFDLCLSPPTSASRSRPPPHAVDLRPTQSTYRLRHTLTPLSNRRPQSSSASKGFSSASKDLRGKHNARRRFLGSFLLEDDDYRIMRGKYKRREGKVTQVYRKKWVINRLLASTTAARLLASITAARLLVPRPPQNPVVIPQSSHTIIPPPN